MHQRSCCMLGNSTTIVDNFANLNHKFDVMYAKRVFVHWHVGRNFEERDICDAMENLAALEKDYGEVYIDTYYFEDE